MSNTIQGEKREETSGKKIEAKKGAKTEKSETLPRKQEKKKKKKAKKLRAARNNAVVIFFSGNGTNLNAFETVPRIASPSSRNEQLSEIGKHRLAQEVQ